jgi:hypothetical protein
MINLGALESQDQEGYDLVTADSRNTEVHDGASEGK